MPREELTLSEITELTRLLRETFTHLQDLRSRNRLAQWIQFPKIPSILSESIALHLIRANRLLQHIEPKDQVVFGGREADIIVRSRKRRFRVEVKGTGRNAFEYFGPKDISAHYLVWVHFGDFFGQDELEPLINLYTIRNPSEHFRQPLKVRLDSLQRTNALHDQLSVRLIALSATNRSLRKDQQGKP